MYSVIEYKWHMTGHFLNTKIVARSTNKWPKMTETRKNNRNYGASCFQFKIKTVSRIRKLL